MTGILAVWNEVDPAIEDDYNDWYLYEHVPERLQVLGMRRARRYRAVDGVPRYFACYETDTVEVLRSSAYQQQLDNPTDWTRRVMPGFRIMQRGICQVAAALGDGIGGVMAIIQLRPPGGCETALRDRLSLDLLPALLRRRQIVAAQLWQAAPTTAANPTTGLTKANAEQRPVEWVMVIEGGDEGLVGSARQAALEQLTDAETQVYPLYRLMFARSAA